MDKVLELIHHPAGHPLIRGNFHRMQAATGRHGNTVGAHYAVLNTEEGLQRSALQQGFLGSQSALLIPDW